MLSDAIVLEPDGSFSFGDIGTSPRISRTQSRCAPVSLLAIWGPGAKAGSMSLFLWGKVGEGSCCLPRLSRRINWAREQMFHPLQTILLLLRKNRVTRSRESGTIPFVGRWGHRFAVNVILYPKNVIQSKPH